MKITFLMQSMYNEIVCISESVQCNYKFRLSIMSDIIIFCHVIIVLVSTSKTLLHLSSRPVPNKLGCKSIFFFQVAVDQNTLQCQN